MRKKLILGATALALTLIVLHKGIGTQVAIDPPDSVTPIEQVAIDPPDSVEFLAIDPPDIATKML